MLEKEILKKKNVILATPAPWSSPAFTVTGFITLADYSTEQDSNGKQKMFVELLTVVF